MKCARCGHEVSADDLRCPYCHGRGEPGEFQQERETPETERCPVCGSTDVIACKRGYDSCCGCLGFLLFNWIGLLLGLLNAGQVEMHCRSCGAHWDYRR